MSMKNSNDAIGNRTHNLPTCSAVPQPTALPRAPSLSGTDVNYEWSSTSRPPVYLHGMDIDNVTFYFYLDTILEPGILCFT